MFHSRCQPVFIMGSSWCKFDLFPVMLLLFLFGYLKAWWDRVYAWDHWADHTVARIVYLFVYFLPVSVSSSGHYWISVNWRTVISHNTKWVKIMHNSHITQFGLDNAHVQTQGKLVKWPDLISGFTNDWWKSDPQFVVWWVYFFIPRKVDFRFLKIVIFK